jgi:hypothetical protein
MSCYVSFVPEAEVVKQIMNVGSWREIAPPGFYGGLLTRKQTLKSSISAAKNNPIQILSSLSQTDHRKLNNEKSP